MILDKVMMVDHVPVFKHTITVAVVVQEPLVEPEHKQYVVMVAQVFKTQ